MKRFFYIIAVLLICSQSGFAQTIDFPATEYTQDPKANFRLFKTKNMYNFIKLDTRTGQMELVQWSVKGNRMSYKLSDRIFTVTAERSMLLDPREGIIQISLADLANDETYSIELKVTQKAVSEVFEGTDYEEDENWN